MERILCLNFRFVDHIDLMCSRILNKTEVRIGLTWCRNIEIFVRIDKRLRSMRRSAHLEKGTSGDLPVLQNISKRRVYRSAFSLTKIYLASFEIFVKKKNTDNTRMRIVNFRFHLSLVLTLFWKEPSRRWSHVKSITSW